VNLIVCFNVLSKLGDLSDGYFGILKKKKKIIVRFSLMRTSIDMPLRPNNDIGK
jgi:hypothetical protein